MDQEKFVDVVSSLCGIDMTEASKRPQAGPAEPVGQVQSEGRLVGEILGRRVPDVEAHEDLEVSANLRTPKDSPRSQRRGGA